jgi:glycosyltransferase involved in cell wall biosynthesis
MRILHVTEAFCGGVFTSLTRLSNGLASRGHDVHLAFSRRPETPDDVAAHVHRSIVLHELPLVRSIAPIADVRGVLAVRRLVNELRPDVLHLHSSKAGVLGRAAAWLTGDLQRTYYSPRGLAFLQEDHSPRARAFYRWVERSVARLGGTVVACSQSELDLVRSAVRPERAELVENAIDVDAVPLHAPRNDGRMRIGAAGRATYHKNPELFATIAKRLARDGVDFVWIGGGEAADVRPLLEAGVHVTGWLSRSDALEQTSRLDIYVHPSRWEGMPIALIEAQVCGLPAVANDAVGNRDVVRHGVTGYVSHDAGEMAGYVQRLIDDPALRSSMGGRARADGLARFRLDRLVDDFERVYAAS